MACVRTVAYQVKVKDTISDRFSSEREIFVGNNVNQDLARCIGSIMGMKVVERIDKYLGLPVRLNGRSSSLLNYLEDRMW
ncbi:hypothetical protein QQ045_019026 [Rhodiola kirilowii]